MSVIFNVFQVYDAQLDAYLDWDKDTVIYEKSKIKVIQLESNPNEASLSCQPSTSATSVDK